MRTLLAGLQAFKRKPLAILPISVEGLLLAIAVAVGVVPARGAFVAAGAAFPLDIYFDVKQAVATADSWFALLGIVGVSIVVRSGVLVATLALAEDARPPIASVARRILPAAGTIALAFIPVSTLFLAGSAMRYAPFIWVAAPLGFAIAVVGTRRAVGLDVGTGAPIGESVPETTPFLGYVYLVALTAAAISFIGDFSGFLAALMMLCAGPLHALMLLGWRENARAQVYPGGGLLSLAATVAIVAALAVGTFYDRVVRSPAPVAETPRRGSLALLGGADSTAGSGALAELDVRSLGYRESRVEVLSYGTTPRYGRAETHRDLDTIASRVSSQLGDLPAVEALVGHSQAALILDRMLAAGADTPRRSAMFSPSPPVPPRLNPSEPGRQLTRGLASMLRVVGAPSFDIDAPSAPIALDRVVEADATVARLAIWALADSVWLDGDWRRPGEVNIVTISDHVGTTNNGYAVRATRDFLAGTPVEPDSGSWRGMLVSVIRYAFEPWRPESY